MSGTTYSTPSQRTQTQCWTYSHHCQIADKNPSKRWNGEFWWVCICIGFGLDYSGTTFTAYCCFPGMSLQRVFVLSVFVCSVNLSLFSGYHAEGYHAPPIPYGYHAEGYHARTDTFKLTGYHVCRVTTPELPRSIQTSGYRRVTTPAGSF